MQEMRQTVSNRSSVSSPRHVRVPLAAVLVVSLLAGAGAAVGSVSSPQAPPTGAVTAPRSGLPQVKNGHRPGPDILYAKPPRAPQLENTGVWRAKPILVSGASAYRKGEWLYQDYLFDDHGATGVKDPDDPYGASGHLYSPAAGTFTYPTDAKTYANNAADLVEFRVKPLRDATAFRVTLNTLLDPRRTAFTISLGDGAPKAWPFGAGVSSPATAFLTWHGSKAVFQRPVSGRNGEALTYRASAGKAVDVDRKRRQVTIRLPHAVWNPKQAKVRMSIGVGLWDPAAGQYLAPQPGGATETTPGGGTPQGVAIVNVGPRYDEPMPTFAGATMGDTAAGGMALAPWWRERQQSEQLTLGDVTPFSAVVDFAKLAARVIDESKVPRTGPIDRIFASRYSFGQGLDPSKVCFDLAGGFAAGSKCIGRFVGQLQPYALYVPRKARPSRGYGLTLLLHSLSANYNQYLASNNQSQLGERGPGSLVVTPAGRGPDGFYAGVAEADTFEVWADVARRYRVDPTWTTVSGYSMGGFGTYRLLARWPDLFSRGFSVVGAPGSVDDQLISLRNTPLLAWNAAEDELVNIQTSEEAVAANYAAGVRFEEDLFLTADHLTLAANDEYGPGAAFLGRHLIDLDPAAVSYVVDPSEDSLLGRVVADHAYWLSGLATRGKGIATVDVRPPARNGLQVSALKEGAGALTGGEIPALVYRSRTSSGVPTARQRSNELVVTARNLATMVIDVRRAGVTCDVKLVVDTDGPLTIRLPGCDRTVRLS